MDNASNDYPDQVFPSAADDTAVILYTSGTTGRPKGAELSHSNLFVNAANACPKLVPIDENDVALATLPLFHIFGQTVIMNATIATGGTVVLLSRFTPEAVFKLIEKCHSNINTSIIIIKKLAVFREIIKNIAEFREN